MCCYLIKVSKKVNKHQMQKSGWISAQARARTGILTCGGAEEVPRCLVTGLLQMVMHSSFCVWMPTLEI